VLQQKRYKVLSPIPMREGGTYWMRTGSASTNKDNSINLYLDALPRGEWKFQLRELDEEDLRKREQYRNAHPPSGSAAASGASGPGGAFGAGAGGSGSGGAFGASGAGAARASGVGASGVGADAAANAAAALAAMPTRANEGDIPF
jgi:hypothetical protein